MDTLEQRIAKAKSLEALSAIASDVEALMRVEHRPEAEQRRLQDAIRDRAIYIAKLAMTL